MAKITKRAVDALQPDKRRDVFTWDIELRGVNRRRTLPPDRRPKLTRFVTAANGSAFAPAKLVRVAQPGRGRIGEAQEALVGQGAVLKRQLWLPVSTMSQW